MCIRDSNTLIELTINDSMESVVAWDSLSFMSVFAAINDEFNIDPDFDDAIHYTSIKKLCAYVSAQVG